jgi:hypothetical protein
MNGYALILFFILVLLGIHVLDLKPHIQQLAQRLVDIPTFTSKGSSPAIFDLAVRLAYLIALVAVVKMLVMRRGSDE